MEYQYLTLPQILLGARHCQWITDGFSLQIIDEENGIDCNQKIIWYA